MPKDDVVGKVVSGVKGAAKAVEKTASNGVFQVRKAIYGLTPNGYTQDERNAMEDEAIKDLPNWWGKKSKYKDQYADLIRQESRTPGPLGTKSNRDQMVDDMGGQVQRVVTAKNRQNKDWPATRQEKITRAKAAAANNSGVAKPATTPVKISAKQAAGAMSGKGVSKAIEARQTVKSIQSGMNQGLRVQTDMDARKRADDQVAAWDRNNARVATKTLQKDMATGMTKARATSAKTAPSMRSMLGMPKAK